MKKSRYAKINIMQHNKQNKIACIWGATGGLGRAFSAECAGRGYDLCLLGRDAGRLYVLRDGLKRQYGVEISARAIELTDANARALWFKEAPPVSLFVLNAGVDYEGEFASLNRQQVLDMLRLNMEAAADAMHAVLAAHKEGYPLHIIIVCSMNAYYAIPYKAVYGATKAFLLHLARSLRRELAGRGVTITALCPSGIPSSEAYVKNIASHGVFGLITTKNTGFVAYKAVQKALRGKREYVPGGLNRVIRAVSALLPGGLLSAMLGGHFLAAQRKNDEAQQIEQSTEKTNIARQDSKNGVSLTGKIFVITDAVSGLGLDIAREIAARGGSVIGVGGDKSCCESAEAQVRGAEYVCADLSTTQGVRTLAQNIMQLVLRRGCEVAGIIHNAGTYTDWCMTTNEGYERQFAVNYLAGFLLSRELLPLLERSGGCFLAVSLGSRCGVRIHWEDVMLRRRYSGLEAYRQSKLALVMLCNYMNSRQGVRFLAVDSAPVCAEAGPKSVHWPARLMRDRGVTDGKQVVDLLERLPQSSAVYCKNAVEKRFESHVPDMQQCERLYALSCKLTEEP